MRTKYVVTNISALKTKYGAGYAQLDAALKRLIAGDAARKITTTVWDVSDAATMKQVGGRKVSKIGDPKQNKEAIDAIFRRDHPPDYLLLLGSIDVIPHQDLTNPVTPQQDPKNPDLDTYAWGDLPYACEGAYSTDIPDFLAPTRVVGRLPDVTGATDPKYLVRLLDNAATWVSLAPSQYDHCFALSAGVFEGSTRSSIKKIFGKGLKMFVSPNDGPQWNKGELRPLMHFINCHGDTGRMSFYGEDPRTRKRPECYKTMFLRKRIRRGTVAAAICCYGAELYEPGTQNTDKERGICQEYLHNAAYGFFGSTTIAYGEFETMANADILCAMFLKHVRNGDSLGLAALKARQDFVKQADRFNPLAQKTLAQYNLLGDPSIHPVHPNAKATSTDIRLPQGRLGIQSVVSIAEAQPKLDDGYRRRRAQMAKRGPQIASQTTLVKITGIADEDAASRARTAVEQYGAHPTQVFATEIIPPAVEPASIRKAARPNRIFLVTNTAPPIQRAEVAEPRRGHDFSICVVHERADGSMKVVRQLVAHSSQSNPSPSNCATSPSASTN
jgi:hypothetical protein